MTDILRNKDFSFQITKKADGDTPGYFKGIATTPKQDSYGDVIAVGAFQKSIQDRGVAGPRSVKMLAQHQTQWLIGNWKSLAYVGDQLQVEGQIDLENQKGQEYYGYLKKDQLGSMSVGFRTIKRSFDVDSDILTILEGDLREISLVTFPANEDAVVTQVKSLLDGGLKLSDVEKKIAHSYGLTRNQSSAVIREIRRAGLVASAGGTPAVPPVYTEAEIAAQKAAEIEEKRKAAEATGRDLVKEMMQRLERRNSLAEINRIQAILRA